MFKPRCAQIDFRFLQFGDFEPIVEKRCCFPEDIVLKMSYGQKALEILGYYFDVDIVA